MSVPAEQMQSPEAPGADGSSPSPGAAPTTTPQQPKGEQAQADAGIAVAIKLLERAAVAHGATSKIGAGLHKVIVDLVRLTGGPNQDRGEALMPAEVKTAVMGPGGDMGQSPPGAEGGAPPGGAPGGAPPGM